MAKDINIKAPIVNGDWNVAFSDEQHVEHILMAAPGHFKNAPLIGVNMMQYINSSLSPKTVSELERKILLNLEADGAKQPFASVDPTTQTIKANGTY